MPFFFSASIRRTATASGNHWVVVGLAIRIPGTEKIYCLPIHARLHLAGKNQKSEATLAKEMLRDILEWFPDRKLVFIGDGAYSANNLLGDLNPRVTYVGVMRADAAIYDPVPPKPQPDGLLLAGDRLGLGTRELMLVGDFRFDVMAGNAAGVKTVLLANGGRSVMLPGDPEPDYIVSHLEEMLDLSQAPPIQP